MEAMSSPRLTSFGSTLSKLAKNSSVPSVMVSLMIGTGTSMTAFPPGGKVKVREIPVKSPGSVEQVGGRERGREGEREGGGGVME